MPVRVTRVSRDPDHLLETQCNEAGEEKRAEGVDVEGDEILGDIGSGEAFRVGYEAVVRVGWVPGEADEDC
ncbi:hypothetical protein ACET3Z_026010 [Daucus carota]